MAVFAMAGAEGLGNESVETDENAFTEEDENDIDAGADADGGDRGGAGRKPADHHGIDDDHAHPTDFGEDEREGETQGGAKFGAEGGEGEHESVERVY